MNGTELCLYELGKQKMKELIEDSEKKRMFKTGKSQSSRFSLRKIWNPNPKYN